jgi:hypothetical protein
MSYDPTQQVPPPQGYPPNYAAAQQPTVMQPQAPQSYPQPASAAPPPYASPAPVVPTYTQYSSAPSALAPGASSGFGLFWRNLGLTGQAAGLGGVLLFLFFFFAWVSGSNDSFNGFGTASGFDTSGTTLALFPYVWLIFLGILGLIGITWPISQRRWFTHQMATVIIVAISGVMVALEVCFLIEVNSLFKNTNGGAGAGFWLDSIATIGVLGVAIYGLMQDRKTAQLLAANPYQAAQYPGSQPAAYTPPQYPGSQPPPYAPPPQYPGSQPPPQYPGSPPPQYPRQ